jgi:hypothetical protein
MPVRTIGIREQGAWVRSRYPHFQCKVADGLLVCKGELQPTVVSRIYTVEIHYRTGKWPKAFVPGAQPSARARIDPPVLSKNAPGGL